MFDLSKIEVSENMIIAVLVVIIAVILIRRKMTSRNRVPLPVLQQDEESVASSRSSRSSRCSGSSRSNQVSQIQGMSDDSLGYPLQ